MFIQIQGKDLNGETKDLAINTNQIAMIVGDYVHMGNMAVLELDKKNMKIVTENLFGETAPVTAKATEHVENLLNELHTLCGGRGKAKPTTDRKARLKSRKKDFSDEELKLAAKNLGSDEFMQGANDSNKRYGTLDYLLRTSANVNKWLEEQPKEKKKGLF